MTTQAIAEKLVALCREGAFHQAQEELYAEDAVSIEPNDNPEIPRETKGLAGIFEKSRKFDKWVEEMHGCTVSKPLVAGSAIAFTLSLDVTMKGKPRTKMDELCVYEVKNGKIVLEQFFF